MDMDNGARLWMMKHAHQNLWRVPTWYSLEELIGDGYMTYYRVVRKYEGVKKRSHLMSLFKRCYTNHVHDLSKKKTKCAGEVELTEDHDVPIDGIDEVSTLILSMPAPARGLIRAMMTEKGQKQLRKPYRVTKRGRETTNARWCRVAGVSSRGIDLPKLVRTSIGGTHEDDHH